MEVIFYNNCFYLIKIENKKNDQKSKRDALNDRYVDLVDKKRVYYKTVKDFQDVINI